VIELQNGRYTALGSAPSHEPRSISFEVLAGKDQPVEIVLKPRTEAVVKKEQVVNGMEGWDNPNEWDRDGETFRRKRSARTFYAHNLGTFAFVVPCKHILRGGCKLRVLVGYQGPRDYLEVEIEKSKVEWKLRQSGKQDRTRSDPHTVRIDEAISVQLQVAPSAVTVSLFNGTLTKVGTFESPYVDLSKGKFGMDGVDTLGHFKHYPASAR
jgi:hypothetical protein